MPNTIRPPKMPDGDDTWIAKGMPPKTNEGWKAKARAIGQTITPTPDYIFFPNVQVTVFTANELDELIDNLSEEKDREKEEAVAEARREELKRCKAVVNKYFSHLVIIPYPQLTKKKLIKALTPPTN